jgi:hypothetical protein
MAVRLSASSAGRVLLPRNIAVLMKFYNFDVILGVIYEYVE